MDSLYKDAASFLLFLVRYLQRKVVLMASSFESFKNWQVEKLIFKRGIFQKRVWHGSMIGLSVFGVLTSGVFGGQTIISASFPGSGGDDPRFMDAYEPNPNDPVLNSFYDTRTTISQKPRSEIITYKVQSGDTLSSIADKFNISIDTIRWVNDLNDDSIHPGDDLKILPVTGISYTVKSGDTLESIAKKYSADSQTIAEYPFNDIPDDLTLSAGQVLIVPDGVMPNTAPVVKATRPVPSYLATGPGSPTFSAPGGGNFIWPTMGIITQYFSWYHPAIDIANNAAPLISASDGGVVIHAGWDNTGYGNMVMVDHGNGYRTLYAHMSHIYVTLGQMVTHGQTLGQMGSTGRSTGTHCHFEIRYRGIAINPLAILK